MLSRGINCPVSYSHKDWRLIPISSATCLALRLPRSFTSRSPISLYSVILYPLSCYRLATLTIINPTPGKVNTFFTFFRKNIFNLKELFLSFYQNISNFYTLFPWIKNTVLTQSKNKHDHTARHINIV